MINSNSTNIILNKLENTPKTIYLIGGWASIISEKEIEISKKYKIQFYDFGCIHPENFEDYEQQNWMVFNYLNKTFGKNWQKEIDKNTLGFQKWILK